MKEIQDRLKPDPVINFIKRVICKMKEIQDRLKPDPVINFIVAGQTLWAPYKLF